MWFGVVSLFPEMFAMASEFGVLGRAVDRGKVMIESVNPRDFATDRHRTVDDRPYGGGPGLLMKVAPLQEAIHEAKARAPVKPRVVYLSPQGRRLNQALVAELANEQALVLLAGRYEGVDERLIETEIDDEVSFRVCWGTTSLPRRIRLHRACLTARTIRDLKNTKAGVFRRCWYLVITKRSGAGG